MQARRGRAWRVTARQFGDGLPRRDGCATGECIDHRLVGGHQSVAVPDADDVAIGHCAGEVNDAGAGCQDKLIGLSGEVDATVSPVPSMWSDKETADHGRRSQWPAELLCVGDGGAFRVAERREWPRHRDEAGDDAGQDSGADQYAESGHGLIVGRRAHRRQQ